MSPSPRLFASILALLVWPGVQAFAQDIGEAPADLIHDDSRVFDAEIHARLAAELRDFEQRTGVLVYVETLTFIDGGVTAQMRCKQLMDAWLPGRRGMVLCYNRAERALPEFGFSTALQQQVSAMALAKVGESAAAAMQGVADTRERLLAGLHAVLAEISKLPQLSASPGTGQDGRMFSREDGMLAAAFAGVLALGALVGWLLVRWQRAQEHVTDVQFFFPEAEVGQRFGASCGGGVMAEISLRH